MNRNGFIVQLRTYINTVIILCNSNIGRFLSGVRFHLLITTPGECLRTSGCHAPRDGIAVTCVEPRACHVTPGHVTTRIRSSGVITLPPRSRG